MGDTLVTDTLCVDVFVIRRVVLAPTFAFVILGRAIGYGLKGDGVM